MDTQPSKVWVDGGFMEGVLHSFFSREKENNKEEKQIPKMNSNMREMIRRKKICSVCFGRESI